MCACVFIAFAAFFGIWCAIGRCEANAITFSICEFTLAGASCLIPQREQLANRLQESRLMAARACANKRCGIVSALALRDAALLIAAALLSLIAVECADNANWISLPTNRFLEAALIVLAAMAALYFLMQRRGCGPLLITIACIVFGCVQFFLTQYKDMALQPSDLLAWQTAAGVGAGYSYAIGDTLMWSFVFASLAICALEFIVPANTSGKTGSGETKTQGLPDVNGAASNPNPSPSRSAHPRTRSAKRTRKTTLVNLVCFAIIGSGLAGIIANVNFEDLFTNKMNYWDLRYAYRANTFTLGFIAACQDLQITVPEGYDESAARAREEQLAAEYDAKHANETDAEDEKNALSSKTRPNIVIVMNESYADLSLYDGLHAGYTAPLAANLDTAILSGTLNVSVFGGGTCNTEYEFLTGGSMSFLGSGMYPYQQFSLENVPALPRQLQEAGYHAVGIHASYAENWRRDTIYPELGFQDCLFIRDFGASWRACHHTVADSVTYDKVLDALRDNDEPTFAFNVTIQNHGGYDKGGIPAEDQVRVASDFGTSQSAALLDEYLSCIKGSDNDLQALLDELEEFDEPSIVVFFGDHQPSMSRAINDAVFPNEDATSVEHLSRLYETPYFIWANYELDKTGTITLANAAASNTSPNYLAAQVLELAGIPLTSYQKAELMLREKLPALNAEGYQDANGVWHAASEAEAASAQSDDGESEAKESNAKSNDAAAEAAAAYRELGMLHYLEIASKL